VVLTLTAGSGTLSASGSGGVTVAGSDSNTLTLTGTAANIDTFLNTADNIQYTGATDVSGADADTITFNANDGGNSGSGGGSNVSLGTVNINITNVNDAPVIIDQLLLTTLETAPITITLNDLVVVDPDNTYPDDFTLSLQDGANYSRSGAIVTADMGFHGGLSVPVSVNDGTDDSTVVNLTVYVGTVQAVTSTDDSGAGTLRQAILDASDGDMLDLSAISGTISLTSGAFSISKSLIISGPTGNSLIISGNGNDRVFNITSGTVTLSDLTITNGQVTGNGGGILNHGTLILERVTITQNSTTDGGDGGGIYSSGSITAKNCTISGNSSSGNGAGIYGTGSATLTINNATIADNTAAGSQGGIYSSGILNLTNSIIADNQPGDCDCAGDPAVNINNLIADNTCSPALSGDPLLGPLQDNGGSTQTHALLQGSMAIDAADSGTVENQDQRGIDRFIDGDDNGTDLADMGACEYQPGTIQFASSTYNVSENAVTATITVTRENGIDGVVSVDYATSDDTAMAGSDYTAAWGTLTWYQGDAEDRSFTVPILNDTDVEADETAELSLSGFNGAGQGGLSDAVLTIVSNDYTLTVTTAGQGSGTVTSLPIGIDCGAECAQGYNDGTTVGLTASAADSYSTFTGWSGGGCSGTGECSVTVTDHTTVTAIFDLVDSDNDGVPDLTDAFPDDPDYSDDDDGDGMPNTWENSYGLDPDVDDGELDPDGDGLCNLEEFRQDSDPQTVTDGPGIAVLISPENFALDQEQSMTLESGYSGTALETEHAATTWQIARDVDFASEVFSSTSSRYKLMISVPRGILDENTTYYWRVRYINPNGAIWSWSDVRVFTTLAELFVDQNDNGIPDDQEVSAGTPLDLDGDGNDDLSQSDMHCVTYFDGDGQVCMKNGDYVSAVETFSLLDADNIEELEDRPDSMPIGLLNFRLRVDTPGVTATVTMHFSSPLHNDIVWYKYDSVNGWIDYSSHVFIDQDGTSATIVLNDGGSGDADGVANGFVVDPSGPSIPVSGNAGSGGGGGGCFIDTAAHD
ncbi:MAG: hypothetical protein GY868_14235, partial [Deltaproteobacteria bacterium]|nr:hypothetical protein [Deltaproteobacteria bacterium]